MNTARAARLRSPRPLRALPIVLVLLARTASAAADGGVEPTTTVRADLARPPDDRPASTVQRADFERRLPRSAPDALRFEPGVFVQQSAHAQGSAFIRGLTGQQTLLLFDGIRLNNSTWRQGPNQYFFTLDSKSLESIEVVRGGASTRHGSDALGGVIHAHPVEPPFAGTTRVSLLGRGASADGELGGRAQLASASGQWGLVMGAGARSVSLLESAGPLRNPADGLPTGVPRFAADGRHQLGTGFDEVTADGRLVFRASDRHTLTLAAYLYRQYDAPRTDLCPPLTARFDECLTYEEQARSLVYAAWQGSDLGFAAQTARLTLSWQQQYERRAAVRPASFVTERGEDAVDSLGVTLAAQSRALTLGATQTVLSWGADGFVDLVRSRASLNFSDIAVTVERSRGQYLQGSTAFTGGAFVDAQLQVSGFTVRSGGRLGWATADAPADAASGTQAVRGGWIPVAGHVSGAWQPLQALAVIANVDHSFRAPNLDDLTSRQQTGAGFQFENPALRPEQATTFEAGIQVRTRAVTAEAWAFHTLLTNAIGRVLRDVSACPPQTPACSASNFRYQLVNAAGGATVSGVEASVRVKPHPSLTVQSNAAWTLGVGADLVPLSRIPPLNGTAEVGWVHPSGGGLGAALRWAGPQRRLAVSDRSDARIPLGGTPGFAVVDVRASWRVRSVLTVAVVLENLFDVAYRYHGSSVNGPGRGLMATLEISPSWKN